jgi:hypothetical protein
VRSAGGAGPGRRAFARAPVRVPVLPDAAVAPGACAPVAASDDGDPTPSPVSGPQAPEEPRTRFGGGTQRTPHRRQGRASHRQTDPRGATDQAGTCAPLRRATTNRLVAMGVVAVWGATDRSVDLATTIPGFRRQPAEKARHGP